MVSCPLTRATAEQPAFLVLPDDDLERMSRDDGECSASVCATSIAEVDPTCPS